MVEHKKSYSYWERGHGTPYTYPTVGGDAWIYVGLILKLQIKSDVTITFLFFSKQALHVNIIFFDNITKHTCINYHCLLILPWILITFFNILKKMNKI